MTFTRSLATNNYGPAKFVVDGTTIANGTHSTISSAITAASSGDTIFIRDGTYTENLTLKAGLTITAFGSNTSTTTVEIIGKISASYNGTCNISNVKLTTNSDFVIQITGSSATNLNVENCFFNITNNTGINTSSSNANANIIINNCQGDISNVGIAFITSSTPTVHYINYTKIENPGLSSTASTISAGELQMRYCYFACKFTSISAGAISAIHSSIYCQNLNTIALTHTGTGLSNIYYSNITAGTSSAISHSGTIYLINSSIQSTNTNAIVGSGTINYEGVAFTDTGKKINSTTQNGGVAVGGLRQAPSAGFIGQSISNTALNVAMTAGVAKTITSISLTAGVWDLSANFVSESDGTTGYITGSISTVNNTHAGNFGNGLMQINGAPVFAQLAVTVAQFRKVITSTQTHYAVIQANGGTLTGSAGLFATRVG